MSVLIIRAHTRFGLCSSVSLRGADGAVSKGLLIEVSLEGCRISNVGARSFASDERVEVAVAGGATFSGLVRWQRGTMIGLRLCQALHHRELAALVHDCRSAPPVPEARRA